MSSVTVTATYGTHESTNTSRLFGLSRTMQRHFPWVSYPVAYESGQTHTLPRASLFPASREPLSQFRQCSPVQRHRQWRHIRGRKDVRRMCASDMRVTCPSLPAGACRRSRCPSPGNPRMPSCWIRRSASSPECQSSGRGPRKAGGGDGCVCGRVRG
jgi:hypothetical protein